MTVAERCNALTKGVRLPVIAAPMFLISGPDLVIAAARAGIIGAFPTPNARTIDDLEAWLKRIHVELEPEGLGERWAINMIVHPTYERFDAELDLVCRYRPRLVITALGSPRRVLERVHDYGGMVFADVIDGKQARKAVDVGVDGLILVASGAGGHTGRYSAFAFVEEVRSFWSGPIVLGGAIGSGRGIRAALMLGADFAYIGTRFIASRESLASDENRAMLVRARMEDIIATTSVTGVMGNWLRECLERAGLADDSIDANRKVDFSNLHGDTKAWKNIWGAGQGVGHTSSVQTVSAIVDELCASYRQAAEADGPCLEAWGRASRNAFRHAGS
jgi:nitronate monooxygenase